MYNRIDRFYNTCFCNSIFPLRSFNVIPNDPFGKGMPTPEWHLDSLAEPVNRTRLSLELQTTHWRTGQGNLSTFRFSWDMRHDPEPRLEATICLARPINETVGAPSSPPGLVALESLPISVLLFSKQCTSPINMVRRLNRRRASDEAEGSSANARWRQ
jgi:hypothetical protein